MPRLLLNLRNVPEDESEEVIDLMARNDIDCYQTPPGPLGITAGGIWLKDREDYPRARELMDEYQAERARKARAEHDQAIREGRAETLGTAMRRRPVQVLLYIGLAIFILLIFFGPVVALFRAGSG
jgi:hypothetical protein